MSTGKGFVGNNTFAYCNNNPVCCADSTGELTRGRIHNLVLDRIVSIQPYLKRIETCIYYNGVDSSGKWGFCDLYNPATGEVWELKRGSTATSCQKSNAIAQLDKYLSGRLKYYKQVPLTAGTTRIINGKFTVSDNNGTYYIWYSDGGDGIIFYDYVYLPKIQNKAAVSALGALGLLAEAGTIIGLGLMYSAADAACCGGIDEKTDVICWDAAA